MTTDFESLARTYLSAWSATDVTQRREILAKIWDDMAFYCDPLGRADGLDGFVDYIAGAQVMFPDHALILSSGVDHHDGGFRFSWQAVSPAGDVVIDGTDFATLGDSNKISSVVGFFGPLPEKTA